MRLVGRSDPPPGVKPEEQAAKTTRDRDADRISDLQLHVGRKREGLELKEPSEKADPMNYRPVAAVRQLEQCWQKQG